MMPFTYTEYIKRSILQVCEGAHVWECLAKLPMSGPIALFSGELRNTQCVCVCQFVVLRVMP